MGAGGPCYFILCHYVPGHKPYLNDLPEPLPPTPSDSHSGPGPEFCFLQPTGPGLAPRDQWRSGGLEELANSSPGPRSPCYSSLLAHCGLSKQPVSSSPCSLDTYQRRLLGSQATRQGSPSGPRGRSASLCTRLSPTNKGQPQRKKGLGRIWGASGCSGSCRKPHPVPVGREARGPRWAGQGQPGGGGLQGSGLLVPHWEEGGLGGQGRERGRKNCRCQRAVGPEGGRRWGQEGRV